MQRKSKRAPVHRLIPSAHAVHARPRRIHTRYHPALLPTHFHPRSLMPTHVRTNLLDPHTVNGLNENPSIEGAFGKEKRVQNKIKRHQVH